MATGQCGCQLLDFTYATIYVNQYGYGSVWSRVSVVARQIRDQNGEIHLSKFGETVLALDVNSWCVRFYEYRLNDRSYAY